jgi:hypothetical protein
VLDDDAGLAQALEAVDGIDAAGVIAALDSPEVTDAYERDRAESRTAGGSPTEFQGKAAASDGPVRYTAPSLCLEGGGKLLEAGGFQPVEAYDVLIANLDPTLERRPAPEDPEPLLRWFPAGLATAEVAALMAEGNTPPSPAVAEAALVGLLAEGRALRRPLGGDALWFCAG